MIITPKQRENLASLAAGLRHVEDIKFDMSLFVGRVNNSGHPYDDANAELNECGFAACAVGWATILLNHDIPMPVISFNVFAHEVLGVEIGAYQGTAIGSLWDECFDDAWSKIDNTPGGAADRIEAWLEANPS